MRTEKVPWARPGARHTRDFEDVTGWLIQRADKTTVARLLGCAVIDERAGHASAGVEAQRELKEQLREPYRSVDPADARADLKRWCASALPSKAFGILARRIRKHFDAVIAAVQLGLSNSRLAGVNSKIRVIQRRGYGHPTPESLMTMVYLS